MKELRSKKTGLVQVLSEDDYKTLINAGSVKMSNFIVTDIHPRQLIPSLSIPIEVKTPPEAKRIIPKSKRNEG